MSVDVAVAGSTGSIGTQTLDVIRANPGRYRVTALGAARSVDLLAAQARELRPDVVALADEGRAAELKALVPEGTEVRAGVDALASLGTEGDVVVNGVVGFAGLGVTLAALRGGRRLGLANKESLIAAGPVVAAVRHTPGAELVPIDSEHGAIHQCLAGIADGRVARLVLTASGGPFRGRTAADLAGVTVEQALAHPTWAMGPKITVDSSTLMNKGLEVIEAFELFGPRGTGDIGSFDQIDVVVHPQSIVHSMVTCTDGSTIGQLSHPDMRLPIGYALAWPDRLDTPFGAFDWAGATTRLDFEPPDRDAFRCLDLAYEAGRLGGGAPAWLNAANEIAVEAFLAGSLPWVDIAAVLADALEGYRPTVPDSAEAVVDIDQQARAEARRIVAARTSG